MAKILIHSLIFSPDSVSTAYLYNDIASRFKKEGYDVVVLTTTPHFNIVKAQLDKQPLKWKILGLLKESNYQGIKVYHIPQKKFKLTVLRLLGFLFWHIISFFTALSIKDVDIILSPSPPLTLGLLNIFLAKLKNCKVVYNVQEIYPDILNLKNGIVLRVLKSIERKVYNSSSAVTTIDQVFYDSIVERFEDKSKLHIIPNFVDTDLYKPEIATCQLDKNIFPESNSIKLLYAGNIGFAQDWEPLIALAEKTKIMDIDYYVIGEGVQKKSLEDKVIEKQLSKIHILPYQAREKMPSIIAYSDIQFIFMNPKMDMQGFPSKVYTIMACGKPLLICSSKDSPIVKFLEEYNCSEIVVEQDIASKVEHMYNWLCGLSRNDLKSLGNNGLIAIRNNYTSAIVTRKYIRLVNELIT